jgi:hypothetical protein
MIQESPGKRETDAIGTLTAYSFITKQLAGHFFDLHRLVHLKTRHWFLQEKRLDHWMGIAMSRVDAAFPELELHNRIQLRAYLPHAMYLLKSDHRVLKLYKQRVSLLSKRGSCFAVDMDLEQLSFLSLLWNEVEDRITKEYHGTEGGEEWTESVSTLKTRYDKSIGVISQFNEALRRARQIMEELMAIYSTSTASLTSTSNLPSIYQASERFEEVEELRQLIRNQSIRVPEGVVAVLLSEISRLAWIEWEQGQFKVGEELALQVLKMSTSLRGESDRFALLMSAALTWMTCWRRGEWERAAKHYLQSLEKAKSELEEEDSDTVSMKVILACAWKLNGKEVDATKLLEECVAQQGLILGLDCCE